MSYIASFGPILFADFSWIKSQLTKAFVSQNLQTIHSIRLGYDIKNVFNLNIVIQVDQRVHTCSGVILLFEC